MEAGKDYIGTGAGVIILNDQQEVLLMLRSANARNDQLQWSIPGGEVEMWEACTDAIMREALEEVGVELVSVKSIGSVDIIDQEQKIHWVSQIYVCRYWNGEPKNMEPIKCDDLGWFFLDKLPDNLTFVAGKALKLLEDI